MESNGWVFDWSDQFDFNPSGFCDKVPTGAYCGFKFPSDGSISITLGGSGSGFITFGNGYHDPNSAVVLYKNNIIMASAASGISSVTHGFDFRPGDVIRLTEHGDSVIAIHNIVFQCKGTMLCVLLPWIHMYGCDFPLIHNDQPVMIKC